MRKDSFSKLPLVFGLSQLALTIFYLAGTQGLSEYFLQQRAGVAIGHVKAILRDDMISQNASLLARRLADLEKLGTIRCVSLSNSAVGNFYSTRFKEGCDEAQYLFAPPSRTATVESISGQKYEVSVSGGLEQESKIYLLISRLLGIILINTIGYVVYRHLRSRNDLLRKNEVNRFLLEEEVQRQSSLIADLKIDNAVKESLSMLSYQVAHDIRAPLSVLKLALPKLAAVDSEESVLITKSLSRINSIASDLLSRRKAGKSTEATQTNTCEFDLSSAIEDLIDEVILFHSSTDIKIRFKHNDTVLVHFDPSSLIRVLSNLINNAVEASGPDQLVTVSLEKNSQQIVIYVLDHGMGIEPALLDRLGKEAVRSTKVGDSGSGLGLFFARKEIERLNGKLAISSRIGEGTLITISLPNSKVFDS